MPLDGSGGFLDKALTLTILNFEATDVLAE
jgi:hypothetical protein